MFMFPRLFSPGEKGGVEGTKVCGTIYIHGEALSFLY